jgi:hypothetical protein
VTRSLALSGERLRRRTVNAAPSGLKSASPSSNGLEGAAARVQESGQPMRRPKSSPAAMLSGNRQSTTVSVRWAALVAAGVCGEAARGAGGLSRKSKATAPMAQNAKNVRPRRSGASFLMPRPFALHEAAPNEAVRHGHNGYPRNSTPLVQTGCRHISARTRPSPHRLTIQALRETARVACGISDGAARRQNRLDIEQVSSAQIAQMRINIVSATCGHVH